MLLLGDFNIHVDTDTVHALEFMSVLDCFNLQQHIDFPTHVHGHTLDLVCSTGIDIIASKGSDIGVSDHKLIEFSCDFYIKKPFAKSLIVYRAWKLVDPLSFSAALSDSLLSDCCSLSSTEDILNVYDESISTVLNHFAPIKSRQVSSSRSSPWFNTELRAIKIKGRRLERFYKKTGLIVHFLAYTEDIKQYRNTLNAAHSSYFSTFINKSKNRLRTLFYSIKKLIQPPAQYLEGSDQMCDAFLNFFQSKTPVYTLPLLPLLNFSIYAMHLILALLPPQWLMS